MRRDRDPHAPVLAQIDQLDSLAHLAGSPARFPQHDHVGPEGVGPEIGHELIPIVAAALRVAAGRELASL
jgi:hypothetical protein